jgi:hypothetical protein
MHDDDDWTRRATIESYLGTFVGSMNTAEAIKAVRDNTPGEWIVFLETPDSELLLRAHGWSWDVVEDDKQAVLVVSGTEGCAGNPVIYKDAPLVLSFVKSRDLTDQCSLYTGGLVLKSLFGDYHDHTLTLLVWHSVWHETESGDIAPGFAPFRRSST